MISAPRDVHNVEFFRIVVHELSLSVASEILGVSQRTIQRWLANEEVPKYAALALFWESRYGRSIIDSDHQYEVHLMSVRIRILEQQLVKAKDIITGLRKMSYGTANEPVFDDLREFEVTSQDAQTYPPPSFRTHRTPRPSQKRSATR